MSNSNDSIGCSCTFGGCLVFLLACVFFWALVFGVTWEGKHYGISCTRARGVEIEK